MSKILSWLKRVGRKGQTTSEYVIILGLVALGSIAVILLFGNQIRALFGSGTRKMAGQSTTVETKYADDSTAAEEVSGLDTAFENP